MPCSGQESRSSRICAELAVTIKCGIEAFCTCMAMFCKVL
jgi:hypothetical protein